MSFCVPKHDEQLQRAAGAARFAVDGSDGTTRVADVFQRHPLRLMFPRVRGHGVSEVVLVNAAGGVAGADHLEVSVTARRDASISVTSQAAEKIYRALSRPARIATRLEVRDGARLAWLPQETILFDRARLTRTTEIDLDGTGELLALEWLVLGRTAYGETLVGGEITDRWSVRIGGRLRWADCLRVTDPVFAHLGSKALLAGCTAVGTLVCFGTGSGRRLEFFRQWVPSADCQLAATSIAGLVIVRLLARTSAALRGTLHALLKGFAREFGSDRFQVPKMWRC